VAVEVLDDKALALPPLNMKLAMDAIEQTRIYKQLVGYRDRPRADLETVALTLVKVSRMAADLAEIAELDINPLFADENGAIALDARVRVRQAKRGVKPEDRLAIRPYPVALEEPVEIAGKKLLLRPVRPEDEPMFQDAFKRLSPQAVRLRFFAPLKVLTHQMAAHFSQIDYDREMALVLVERKPAGKARGYGVARILSEPDKARAEFAITVTTDMAGKGLGALLMNRLIDYARDYGIGEIYGDVLAENTAMLGLARSLGFHIERTPDEPEVLRVRLPLAPAGKRSKR
jgi:acetyltransferase